MQYYYSYYSGYTAAQFADDEYFREWVLDTDREKYKFWNSYLQLYPEQQHAILKARRMVFASLNAAAAQPLTEEEKMHLKNNIYQQIKQPVRSFKIPLKKNLQLLKIAAVVFGIIIIPAYFFAKDTTSQSLIVERTGAMETKEIMLADSTVVILNANSSITYNSNMASLPNREISLKGNAYFKVKKKVDHAAFTVSVNSLSIAVLGTEFNVNARTKATEIVLTTGKVKVSSGEINIDPVYMSPGEMLQLDTLHNVLVKSNADTLLYSAWTGGKWNFNSTTLVEITSLIYEYYGIESVYTNGKAKQLKISAVVPVTDLGSFINILAKTLDLKISEVNSQLVIQ